MDFTHINAENEYSGEVEATISANEAEILAQYLQGESVWRTLSNRFSMTVAWFRHRGDEDESVIPVTFTQDTLQNTGDALVARANMLEARQTFDGTPDDTMADSGENTDPKKPLSSEAVYTLDSHRIDSLRELGETMLGQVIDSPAATSQ